MTIFIEGFTPTRAEVDSAEREAQLEICTECDDHIYDTAPDDAQLCGPCYDELFLVCPSCDTPHDRHEGDPWRCDGCNYELREPTSREVALALMEMSNL